MSLEHMRQRVRTFADKECGLGATTRQIAQAESSLGICFPESYRRFLQWFGWARFSHEQLYGLGNDVPAALELLRNTLAERKDMVPRLPHWLIPVMNDGAGNHYCLNTRQMRDNECPMVFWDHELGKDQQPQPTAVSFDRWLIELLDSLDKEVNGNL